MSRCPVLVRDAAPADAPALLTVWSALSRPDREPEPAAAAAASAVARIAADPDQRLLVAQLGDEVVGAVHLVRAQLSPVHCESAVHVAHLQVREGFRRHGVGRSLMEAMLTWAEEKDTVHVLAAASVGSRDANRFMARLGLGQVAVVRGTTVAALRAKLPVAARVTGRGQRNVGQVLAQRRSLRRQQARVS